MRRALPLAALVLAAACSSAPRRPGPAQDGLAVRVAAARPEEARREALSAVLPLYLTADARREKAAALESAVFSKAKELAPGTRLPKKGDRIVLVRVEDVAAALQKAGLVRPPGYAAGPEVVLIAFGDRAKGPDDTERFAADAFETALFARGIQAQDADDRLLQLAHPITAKTEEKTVDQAAAGGWGWLAAGRVENSAREEPQSGAWRARAELSVSLYALGASREPSGLKGQGEAVDVSSRSAVLRAMEGAAQDAAVRVDGVMAKRRGDRAILAVLVSGYKDFAYLARVVGDLRKIPGVEGAALMGWHEAGQEMALFHAYARGLKADELAARLIREDSRLRVDAIETEDNRLTLMGPEIPMDEDEGK